MIEKIKKLFFKYKEIILYVFFGGMTTVVDWLIYFPLVNFFGVYYQIANVPSWIVSVIFAFIVNKKFVFESKSRERKTIAKELAGFAASRLFSLLAQAGVMYVFVTLLGQDENLFKIITGVIVVIINYVFSKFLVFVKK